MTDWDRKNLDTIHDAIENELKGRRVFGILSVALLGIKNKTSMAFHQNSVDLLECRTELCDLCRKHKIYNCDVEVGWTTTCAFLKSNAT